MDSKSSIDILVLAYHHEAGAQTALQVMRRLQARGGITLINAAVLVRDDKGGATIRETQDAGPGRGALFGAVVGGLIGLIGGPGGVIAGVAAGAAAGGTAARQIDMGFDDDQLQRLQQHLSPGSSALIALVEHRMGDSFSGWIREIINEGPMPAVDAAEQAGILIQRLEEKIAAELEVIARRAERKD